MYSDDDETTKLPSPESSSHCRPAAGVTGVGRSIEPEALGVRSGWTPATATRDGDAAPAAAGGSSSSYSTLEMSSANEVARFLRRGGMMTRGGVAGPGAESVAEDDGGGQLLLS